jgi:hypothetical protein
MSLRYAALEPRRIARQLAWRSFQLQLTQMTHSIIAYDDPADFRRRTMLRMIDDFVELGEKHEMNLIPATITDVAAACRNVVHSP